MIPLHVRIHRECNRCYSRLLRLFWQIQKKDMPCVYMFHSVVDSIEQVYSQFAITRDSFERFIEYKVHRGEVAMDTSLLLKAIENPKKYQNHFCITFDDIYDSVFTNAYPILKKYDIPFVIFLTDALVDTIDPWSRNPMITSDHLLEILNDPLCILASHGTEHVPFRKYDKEQAVFALQQSKWHLEKKYNKTIELFAFPFGRLVEVSTSAIRQVKKAGYTCGFSALDGSLGQKWWSGRWFLPRVLVGEDYVKTNVR